MFERGGGTDRPLIQKIKFVHLLVLQWHPDRMLLDCSECENGSENNSAKLEEGSGLCMSSQFTETVVNHYIVVRDIV